MTAPDIPTTVVWGESLTALGKRWGVPSLHLYDRVGSTNDIARGLAERGAPAGTTVVAREQISGRGRSGRGWSSAPDVGLWTSVVAHPDSRSLPGAFPLLTALHVALALEALLGPRTIGIKWPNDLTIEQRKVAGILCEAAWAGENPLFAIVGLGVNVLQKEEDFPPEFRSRAISLRSAGAAIDSVLTAAEQVIPALIQAVSGPAAIGPEALAEIASRDVLRGREVDVSDPVTGLVERSGTAAGIDLNGALLLRLTGGEIQRVEIGTVRSIDEC